MKIKFEKKKNNFFIFNKYGRLNKKDLTILLANLAINKTGPDELFKIIRPQINLKTNLIDRISISKFGEEFFKISIAESKPNYHLPLIFNPFDLDYKNPQLLTDDSGLTPSEMNLKHSKIIFETTFGEEYLNNKIEKSTLYTGIFLSNNIIINIPLEEFYFPKTLSAYDEILKVFYSYAKAMERNCMDNHDKKTFFIAIHGVDDDFSLIEKEKLNSKIYHFINDMQKHCLEILKDSSKGSKWARWEKYIFDFQIMYLPNKIYLRRNFLVKTKEIGLRIIFKGEQTYWEHETLLRKPGKIIDDSNFIISNQLKCAIQEFEKFEKYLVRYPKNLPFRNHRISTLIAEIVCTEVLENTNSIIHVIFPPWIEVVKAGWVQSLGNEIDKLWEKIESFFKTEAKFFKDTWSYQRKFKILKEAFFLDCRQLWSYQIQHLTQNLMICFRSAMGSVVLDESVERNLNSLITIFENEFVLMAKTSIPIQTKRDWVFSYERKNFKKNMKELINEKMKMNYYKGFIVKKPKQPLSIWFHALFPHPFGKDFSNEAFNNDDLFSFERKKNRNELKAELMRYIIQKPRPSWTYSSKYQAILGQMKEEEFVFKEKPKNAIKRIAKSS
jgi:hypothetical protein